MYLFQKKLSAAFTAFVCLIFILSACKSVDPEKEKLAKELEKAEKERRDQWFQDTDGKKIAPERDMVEEMLKSSPFKLNTGKKPENPYPIYTAKDKKNNKTLPSDLPVKDATAQKIKAEFNFNAAPVGDVIQAFASILNLNYLLDDKINGNITLFLNEHLNRRELFSLFQQILQLSNAYTSYESGILKISPVEDSSRTAELSKTSDLELGVFRLKNVKAKETAAQLNQFLSKGVKAIEAESQNMLLILDTKPTLAKIKLLVSQLDQPVRYNWSKMVMPCRNIPASRLADELSEILPVIGFSVNINSEKPDPEAIQLVSVPRLEIIVASAANHEALEELGRWMAILDRSEVGEQERVFVYNILNGKADELVSALTVIFPVESSMIAADKSGTGTTANTANSVTSASSVKKNVNSGKKNKSSDSEDSGSVFDTPVKVFADAIHNRLVIRTTPRTYAMVKALLNRLDSIPAQVLLQALVVDVSLNDSIKFGVEFMMQGGGKVTTSGGTNYTGLVPGNGQQSQDGGKIWLFNTKNPEEKFGYINALAGQTDIKVISSPQVLVISHTEAELSVGNKVPVVNSEITNTQSIISAEDNSSTNLVRNIQYLDTGVILKITPHVTKGGRITIDLDQTVSEADENKTSGIDSPIIKEQKLKTSMSIRDGQTIICGGLIREKISDSLSTLPIIGSIPFVRRLIGDTNVSTERTEMLVLITGHIITEKTKLDELLKRYKDAVDSLMDFHAPEEVRKMKLEQKKGLLESWFIE